MTKTTKKQARREAPAPPPATEQPAAALSPSAPKERLQPTLNAFQVLLLDLCFDMVIHGGRETEVDYFLKALAGYQWDRVHSTDPYRVPRSRKRSKGQPDSSWNGVPAHRLLDSPSAIL